MPRQYTPRVDRICERCGEPFSVQPNQTERGRGKFCSRTCQIAASHAARRARALNDFWSRMDKSGGPDSCWEWTGLRHDYGYGMFLGRRAHRFAWELTNGPIPDGLFILHSCDNPPCCNPAHLSSGTQEENLRQMAARGRGGQSKGERSGRAKLTWESVRAIRAAYDGSVTTSALARQYGVSHETMRVMLLGRTWIEEP